ncbi:glycosyltransferase 87 family protein [Asanoa sp. WMMD1127]|uniref:glycosyltransferase 87 family protein n=1 Tax=Asanoa sp. WMMD1127 TaxID=3016107 RepID=UPI002417C591|nr:glycosyltransferase 87 family protein [Asanoa sp. WMMD1127]MDG4822123.1 glycosyltransferase 87 family protein [Asanoa sp. WMMD1127]
MPATVGRRMDRLVQPSSPVRGIYSRNLVRLGLIAGAFVTAWYAIGAFGRPYNFFDMKIYHGAAVWWASGRDLYAYAAPDTGLGFTYPPFAGLLMLPISRVPFAAAAWINVVASLLALAVVMWALLGPIARRYGWTRWFAVGLAVPAAAAIEPVRESLGYGQINLLLFLLVMADLVALRWRARTSAGFTPTGGALTRFVRSGAWAGVGIGLAASIKLTPALFVIYLLVTKQWRAAMTAVATAIGVSAATFMVAGKDSAAYFLRVIWETERVGQADMTPNQSLAGVLARLYDTPEAPTLLWLSFALLVFALGLSRAARAHADGDELTAFVLVGLTANVISPISWSHHLTFVIPAILVLADAAMRRRDASKGLESGRRLTRRGLTPSAGMGGLAPLRTPIWFPALTGLRHASAAIFVYLLFLVSPIWPYEHQLPEYSHYEDGLWGALMENSLALALIVLVAALPWRPGAEPAFYPEKAIRIDRRAIHQKI